jgi:hypothetical protein
VVAHVRARIRSLWVRTDKEQLTITVGPRESANALGAHKRPNLVAAPYSSPTVLIENQLLAIEQ